MTSRRAAMGLFAIGLAALVWPTGGGTASAWFGMGAPKNTPAEIITKLSGEVDAILAEPTTKARIAELGGISMAGSPADFGKTIAAETEKWEKVVKFSGAKVE
jgi:tripartite-type tricarboxylate transporter receptor subunit TctC